MEVRSSPYGDSVYTKREIGVYDWIQYDPTWTGKIKDLSYDSTLDLSEYYTDDNLSAKCNIRLLVDAIERDEPASFYEKKLDTRNTKGIYLGIINDVVPAGTELSRCCGREYWDKYRYYQRNPLCNYYISHRDEDLPSEWYYIEDIRQRGINSYKRLYGKKDETGYHYAIIKDSWQLPYPLIPYDYDYEFLECSDPDYKIKTPEDSLILDSETYYRTSYVKRLGCS